jgi:tRNA(fMet)-specific endonuclease VapC
MGMKRLLIDTNTYSHALRGDKSIAAILQKTDSIGISSISIGELISGFKGGNREIQNREELDIFLSSSRVTVYPVDEGTATFYAEIRQNLKTIGKPIPTNDIWIAACAFQHGLRLFSADRHFKSIPGLTTV